jgi:plasmid stabilization system protein ParE
VRVTFNELAERELNDAIQYFEHEQSGLGAAFLAEVRRCTSAITEHPEAGSVVVGRIRRRLCQRFPYGLLYIVTGSARASSRQVPTATATPRCRSYYGQTARWNSGQGVQVSSRETVRSE